MASSTVRTPADPKRAWPLHGRYFVDQLRPSEDLAVAFERPALEVGGVHVGVDAAAIVHLSAARLAPR